MPFRLAAAFSLTLAGGLSAYGKADMPKEIPDFEVRPAIVIGPDDLVDVGAKQDWKGWLDKKFPDASETWPKAASAAFAKALGDAKWDFIGKGDFDRDGAPTCLLIGVERLPKTGHVIVKRLAVLKWLGDRWTELLRMDGGKGVRMNGNPQEDLSQPRFYAYTISFYIGEPKEAAHPGASISMNVVNREGRVLAEPIHFCFLPGKKKYASLEGDGDWTTD